MKNLEEISKMPTIIDNVHQSCYRSYHVLEYVLCMVARGDSKETIKDVCTFISSIPIMVNSIKKDNECNPLTSS